MAAEYDDLLELRIIGGLRRGKPPKRKGKRDEPYKIPVHLGPLMELRWSLLFDKWDRLDMLSKVKTLPQSEVIRAAPTWVRLLRFRQYGNWLPWW